MVGVLDLETIEADTSIGTEKQVKNTWFLRVPNDVCNKEGLAEGTLISLTIKNGGIQSQFIAPPSKEMREIGKQIIEKDKELYRRLKEIGD
jgi:hypothetical protein